jgi:serine/threonine protein kinase
MTEKASDSDSTLPPKPAIGNEESLTLPPPDDPTRTQPYVKSSPHSWQGLDLAAGVVKGLPVKLGRYQLRRLLGKGGMGAVYLAHDVQLDRLVALKVPALASAGVHARERFFQEAQAAATLSHPNLCPVFDAGTIDGVDYLTMAYIEGQPLSRLLRDGRSLPERTAAGLIRQLALAMQAAHDKGIIHRDLKPQNIMITPKKQPVIMDFGLARRSTGSLDARLTQSGQFMGTPAYMSPEQIDGVVKAIGPGCDIYSLGVILYQLLAGRLPFNPSVGLGSLLAQIVSDPPASLRELRPELSPELEALCLRMLAKKPGGRPRSMAEVAGELEAILRGSQKATTSPEQDPSRLIFAQLFQNPDDRTSENTKVVSSSSLGWRAPRSGSRAPSPPRTWLPWLVGGAVAGIAALGGMIFIFASRAPKGTVLIELSNPRAVVDVRVDGRRIEPGVLDQALALDPGEHEVTVQGAGFETVAEPFTIRADKESRLPIKLKALRPPAPPPAPVSEHNETSQPTASANKLPPPNTESKGVQPSPPPGGAAPMPALADEAKTREAIRKTFANEYAAQDRRAWITLAERLRGQAESTKDNPIQRSALWQEARQLAVQAAATNLALGICDEFAQAFSRDAAELKAACLREINQILTSPSAVIPVWGWGQLNRQLAAAALDFVQAAVDKGEFSTAYDFLLLASAADNRAKVDADTPLLKATPAEIQALKPAFSRLQENPKNAAANLQLGRFFCLSEERWPAGLPLLVKSDDFLLAEAARLELTRPTDAPARIEAGDAWKAIFDREPQNHGVAQRARAWYDLALSELPTTEASTQGTRRQLLSKVRQIGGAPNLTLVKPFFVADASDPNSGFPVHQFEKDYEWDSGFAKGRWFMKTQAGYWFGTEVTRFSLPFACQVVARVEPPTAAWDLIFFVDKKHSHKIHVNGVGSIQVLFHEEKSTSDQTLFTHIAKSIKPHTSFDTFLIVGRSRQLDLYVNGAPLTPRPVILQHDIGPGGIDFGVTAANSGGGLMEVKRLTLWPAEGVPTLGK